MPAPDRETEFQADDLRALIDLIAGTDVEELEVDFAGTRVRLVREAQAGGASAPTQDGQRSIDALGAEGVHRPREDANGSVVVSSPLVGLFFRGREPGGEPIAHEGHPVRTGQVLVMVESLRVPHPVESPVDGLLTQVLVEDGCPVEFGQPLVEIRLQH